jgi:hypothetical protein
MEGMSALAKACTCQHNELAEPNQCVPYCAAILVEIALVERPPQAENFVLVSRFLPRKTLDF